MIENANANFASALVDAATAARVQKHKQGNQQPGRSQMDGLIREKASLDKKANHPHIRPTDKIRILDDLA